MKIIFLDVDGVLNNYDTLMLDESINPFLVANLAYIVKETDAKIVVSSSWRCAPPALAKLMTALNREGLYVYNITQEGVSKKWLKDNNIKVKLCPKYDFNDEICFDRGAEIAYWLAQRQETIESFVILDDEEQDIKDYFPNNLVKTSFKEGLIKTVAEEAIRKLKGE